METKATQQIWYEIGASPMVMSVINEGYKIPFTNEPPPMFLNNNKSALLEYVFVTESQIHHRKTPAILYHKSPVWSLSSLWKKDMYS